MKRRLAWLVGLAVVVLTAWLWFSGDRFRKESVEELQHTESRVPDVPRIPSAAEKLLEGYGDPSLEPIEDLRKIHRIAAGYFSVIKDSSKNPIGGNADFSAALRGENPNREIFLRADHKVFVNGLLVDRWGTPVVVHPEGWRSLELRSAGPDKKPYTEDDLIILPTGLQPETRR